MEYRVEEAAALLERTPAALRALLAGLPDAWVHADEGAGTWSPYDVVGHLIHGERADWIPRVEHLLEHGDAVAFPVFDREAMLGWTDRPPVGERLDDFARLRARNLERLRRFGFGPDDLARRGRHPEFGVVTLAQHLSTWVAHDLSHLAQIARVMARQYAGAVGPWRKYLPILGPEA